MRYFLARKLILYAIRVGSRSIRSLAKNKNTFPAIIQGSFVAFAAIIKFTTFTAFIVADPKYFRTDFDRTIRATVSASYSPNRRYWNIGFGSYRKFIRDGRSRGRWNSSLARIEPIFLAETFENDLARDPWRIVLQTAMKSRFPSNEENPPRGRYLDPTLSLSFFCFLSSLFFTSCACFAVKWKLEWITDEDEGKVFRWKSNFLLGFWGRERGVSLIFRWKKVEE